jgi:hypothetical protein
VTGKPPLRHRHPRRSPFAPAPTAWSGWLSPARGRRSGAQPAGGPRPPPPKRTDPGTDGRSIRPAPHDAVSRRCALPTASACPFLSDGVGAGWALASDDSSSTPPRAAATARSAGPDRSARRLLAEDPLPPIAPLRHVMRRVRDHHPRKPGHLDLSTIPSLVVMPDQPRFGVMSRNRNRSRRSPKPETARPSRPRRAISASRTRSRPDDAPARVRIRSAPPASTFSSAGRRQMLPSSSALFLGARPRAN